MVAALKPFNIVGFVTTATFDTLVFIAISVKVLRINAALNNTGQSKIVYLIRGRGMSHISTVLLRSGQLYYL